MGKRVFTTSLFVLLAGSLIASFVIQVPDHVWWDKDRPGSTTTPLLVWVFMNLAPPIAAGSLIGLGGCGIWELGSYLYGRLLGSSL